MYWGRTLEQAGPDYEALRGRPVLPHGDRVAIARARIAPKSRRAGVKSVTNRTMEHPEFVNLGARCQTPLGRSGAERIEPVRRQVSRSSRSNRTRSAAAPSRCPHRWAGGQGLNQNWQRNLT